MNEQVHKKLFSVLSIFLFMIFIAACNSNSDTIEKEKSVKPVVENSIPVPQYKIIKEANNRFDKAASLYILIDPIDLKDSKFKDDVKLIIKDIAAKRERKFSANIYDDQKALDVSFKESGDMSLNRPLNSTEKNLLAVHFISTYTGELSTNYAPYTLDFFPATSTKDKKVGKYVEGIEFKP